MPLGPRIAQTLTTDGQKALPIGYVDQWDVRDFGAAVDPPANQFPLVDSTAGIQAAIDQAAPIQFNGFQRGVVKLPMGNFAVSKPLWIKTDGGIAMQGAGKYATRITVGSGDPLSNPNLVQGFSGPLIAQGGVVSGQPAYGSDLFGGSGRSLVLSDSGNTLARLSDAYPLYIYLKGRSAMAIQMRVKIGSAVPNGSNMHIFGSRGTLQNDIGARIAYGIYLTEFGGGPQLSFFLSTVGSLNTGHALALGVIAYNTTYDISFNYDGGHVDVYVNGVNKIHDVQTGNIVQEYYEGVTFGMAGSEGVESWSSFRGQVQSVQVSNIARHTGTGSYTPPTVPFVWDSNTIALYNFDQGDVDATCPFMPLGQVWLGPTPGGGGVVHYARLRIAAGSLCQIKDMSIAGGVTCTCLYAGGSQSSFENLYCVGGYMAFFNLSGNAFYDSARECDFHGQNWGAIAYLYDSSNLTVSGGGFSAKVQGVVTALNSQPTSTTLYDFVIGNNGFGGFTGAVLIGASTDTEAVAFTNYKGCMLVTDGTLMTAFCGFQAPPAGFGSNVTPCVVLDGLGEFGNTGGDWTSISDLFVTQHTASGFIEATAGAVAGRFYGEVQLIAPRFGSDGALPPLTSTGVPIRLIDSFSYADASGTPGNATINTAGGRFAIAAGTKTATITNVLCNAKSRVKVTKETLDATLTDFKTVPGVGSFVVTGNANATAAVVFSFEI